MAKFPISLGFIRAGFANDCISRPLQDLVARNVICCLSIVADGPYGVFAGKDASRGLATFSVDGTVLKEEYDDLSDLNSMQVCLLYDFLRVYGVCLSNDKVRLIPNRPFRQLKKETGESGLFW